MKNSKKVPLIACFTLFCCMLMSSSSNLILKPEAPRITSYPQSLIRSVGEGVSFPATVIGTPEPSCHIYFGPWEIDLGTTILVDGRHYRKYRYTTKGNLHRLDIYFLEMNDEGEYKFSFINSSGMSSTLNKLTVYDYAN